MEDEYTKIRIKDEFAEIYVHRVVIVRGDEISGNYSTNMYKIYSDLELKPFIWFILLVIREI